ncbi:hypothetical protein TEA_007080 [Camellia sinensis var. sinensis]|uniref:Uncharacterized protein n=1 Tax=Camellia sinensis var. sinensis TaxID=542762 RepID=A0A4S4CZ51_CAMSN|nr:hypothetical protein TEA_007080 [Camellia sinensis var. sinensis]
MVIPTTQGLSISIAFLPSLSHTLGQSNFKLGLLNRSTPIDQTITEPTPLSKLVTSRPLYYVTEPPDSPHERSPTIPTTGLGLTKMISTLNSPGPLLPNLGPSYTPDLCLSRAIKSFSLKRKDPDDHPSQTRPSRLLQVEPPPSQEILIAN